MKYRLVYEPGARELVRRLPPALKSTIKAAIESLREDPYAGKELKLELAGLHSLRSARYRIVYRVDAKARTLEVLDFGHRRNVYELVRNLAKRG